MSDNPTYSTGNLDEATALAAAARLPGATSKAVRVLPVIEERVVIRREIIETAQVVITRHVHEADEQVTVPVQHDEVQVERVAINQTLPAGAVAPATRYEGDTMIIPVLREVVVVEKRLLLVEELRVTKRQLTTEHTEPMHLRREEITIERRPTPPSGGGAAPSN